MTLTIDDLDDIDTKKVFFNPIDSTRIHADDFDPNGSIQRVNQLLNHIDSIDTSSAKIRMNPLVDRVTLGDPISPTLSQLDEMLPSYQNELEKIATQEQVPAPSQFPHLAWEAIKVGLAKENLIHDQLNRHIDAIQEAHNDIALLLDLNAELSGAKEEDSELSDKARDLLEQLKARGIDLKGTNAGEIKRLVGSHESRLRSEIQIKFTTKVQYLMQQIESMNQILQNIIRNDSKLKEKTQQLPR